MDLTSKKLELIDWLMHLNDASLLRQIEKLKRQFTASEKKKPESNNKNDFTKYLLGWPEMTDDEMEAIEEKRKHFNKWK